MKKLLSLLVAAIILLALPCVAVSAAYGAKLTVSDSEARVGENAEVLISIVGSPGLCALGIEVEYDADALTVVSAEFTELFSAASMRVNIQNGRIILNAVSADNINGDGTVARIVFKVLKEGNHAVSARPLADKGFVLHSENDHSLHDVTLETKAGSVATDAAVTDTPATDAPVTACVHANTVNETVKASTCTANGVAIVRCADCGISLGETELPLGEHTVGEWETVHAPTAENEGRAELKCLSCGQTVQAKALDRLSSDSTETTTGSISTQPVDNGNSAVILIVVAAVAVAALLIAFAVYKAKADKKKNEEEFY